MSAWENSAAFGSVAWCAGIYVQFASASGAIQDNVVIHVGGAPCLIGDSVTIGHGAILHGCTVGDGSLVGMGAIIMDGAVVSAGAMVAAGAVVTPGTVVKTGQLWAGNPAKLLRELTDRETTSLASHAEGYVALAQRHSASQT